MQVQMRNVAEIKLYPNNPRRNDQAVAAVAASIRAFGIRQPLVVDQDGVVVVGSTRLKAALLLGLEEVPVHVAVGLSPAQIRAYRLADNKTAELAEWDDSLLVQELLELQEIDFDLAAVGFTHEELRDLFPVEAEPAFTDPDDIPAFPDKPVTQPGDLYLTGHHRLFCGDAAQADAFDRLLDGAAVELVNSEPPNKVRVEPRGNQAVTAGLSAFRPHPGTNAGRHLQKAKPDRPKLRARDRLPTNDSLSAAEYEQLLEAWFANVARVLRPGGSFYLWGGYANCGNYPPVLKASGLHFAQAIVWVKGQPVLTRNDFLGDHACAFYGWRQGAAHRFYGPADASDVWAIQNVDSPSTVRLKEKPVELAVRALQYSSQPGEHVLDPFGSTGSTLIAAEQTGRQAFLMEIDALNCDVIVERWKRFTGKKAERVPAQRLAAEKPRTSRGKRPAGPR
jgi:DNA modification methylase